MTVTAEYKPRMQALIYKQAFNQCPKGYQLWATYETEEKARYHALVFDSVLPVSIGKVVLAWAVYGREVK